MSTASQTHGVNSFIKDFLTGGVSSAASETFMAPLERIKLILQVQTISSQIEIGERYKGLIDALRRIPKEQGLTSLWRGNTISIARCFPIQALNFAIKDKLQHYFRRGVDVQYDLWRVIKGNFVAGGTAGVLALSIVYPLDFARTRIAADVGASSWSKRAASGKERQFQGLFDCLSKTTKAHGIRGLYQGYSISIVGIAIYRACYFGFYDTSKIMFLQEPTKHPLLKKWVMAQSSVAAAGLLSFPFDSLRRRMMMQGGEEERRYKSVADCFRKTVREEGFRALYRGAFINVLRSTGGALVLILYDEIKAFTEKKVGL